MLNPRALKISLAAFVLIGSGFLMGTIADRDGRDPDQTRVVVPEKQKPAPVSLQGVQPLAKPLGPPVAYGFITFDGSVRGSSGNVSCEWRPDRYYLRIAGVNYSSGPYIAFLTAQGNGGINIANTWDSEGALVVCIGDNTGETGKQAGFQFIIYKVS